VAPGGLGLGASGDVLGVLDVDVAGGHAQAALIYQHAADHRDEEIARALEGILGATPTAPAQAARPARGRTGVKATESH
jgi:hypothetical protein